MRKKIIFGAAVMLLVAVIFLCGKMGEKLKPTFMENTEATAGRVATVLEKEKDEKERERKGNREKKEKKKKNHTIILDAGHGGADGGKVGVNGMLEKELNLMIAKKIKKHLEQENIDVIMTRKDDGWLAETRIGDLKERVRIINESNADLAVSIHQNSYHEESVSGAQVFYYARSDEGEEAAKILQDALIEINPKNTKREKANDTYYLLKKTTKPVVIVECGFLSNYAEAEKLSDEAYQEKIAEAVVKGIKSFFLK